MAELYEEGDKLVADRIVLTARTISRPVAVSAHTSTHGAQQVTGRTSAVAVIDLPIRSVRDKAGRAGS